MEWSARHEDERDTPWRRWRECRIYEEVCVLAERTVEERKAVHEGRKPIFCCPAPSCPWNSRKASRADGMNHMWSHMEGQSASARSPATAASCATPGRP